MDNVSVDKNTLIHKLRDNRSKHLEVWEQATAGWRRSVMAALAVAMETFANEWSTKDMNFQFLFPEPVSHLDEYDQALEMLGWETEDKVTLDSMTFKHLVMDNWDWSRSFHASTNQYVAS